MAGSFFFRPLARLRHDSPRQRILRALVFFLILFSTLDSENTGSLYPFIVLSLTSLLVLSLHLLEEKQDGQRLFRWNGITRAFTVFLGWCAFSLVYTIDRSASEYGLIKVFSAGVLLMVIPAVFPRQDGQVVFWKAAVLWASVLSAAGLAQYFFPIGRYGARAHSLFVTPNTFAGYLLIPLPIAFALLRRATRGREKKLWLACVLLLASAFAASGSRGAWLAFLVAGVAWVACGIRAGRFRPSALAAFPWRRRWGRLLVVLICTAIVVVQAVRSHHVAERFQSLTHILTAEPDRYRYWDSAVEIIRTRPWLGYGLRTFIFVYPGHQARELRGTFQLYAHNDYLQMAAETGLVGLGLFAFLSALIAFRGWQAVRRGEGPVATALPLGLWAVLLHSFVDFDFHISAIQTLFWLGTAYLVTAAGADTPSGSSQCSGPRRRLRLVAVLLLLGVVGGTLVRHYLGEITTLRGYARLQRKDLEGARRWFTKAVRVVPYNSFHLANLARLAIREGEERRDPRPLREAEGLLGRALARNPFDSDARIQLGQLYSRNLDLLGEEVRPRLIAVLEEGIVRHPKADLYRRQLGRVLLEGGEPARAVDPLEQYLSWWPEDGQVRLWLATALAGSGRPGRAREEARKILAGDPEHRAAKLLLGKLEGAPLQ